MIRGTWVLTTGPVWVCRLTLTLTLTWQGGDEDDVPWHEQNYGDEGSQEQARRTLNLTVTPSPDR